MSKRPLYAGVMALAMPFTAHWEGLRTEAYLDQANIPTICYGETLGVKMGDKKTVAECNILHRMRLGYFAWRVDLMVEPEMTDSQHAAFTSFSYNVGLNAFRESTLLKKLNNGDKAGACNQLMRWVYIGKDISNGLINRRKAERDLCLS